MSLVAPQIARASGSGSQGRSGHIKKLFDGLVEILGHAFYKKEYQGESQIPHEFKDTLRRYLSGEQDTAEELAIYLYNYLGLSTIPYASGSVIILGEKLEELYNNYKTEEDWDDEPYGFIDPYEHHLFGPSFERAEELAEEED